MAGWSNIEKRAPYKRIDGNLQKNARHKPGIIQLQQNTLTIPG